MSNWEKWTKKYVWDENKTPFFIPVDKLTKLQAGKELFLYVVFVGTPFGLIGFLSLATISRAESIAMLSAREMVAKERKPIRPNGVPTKTTYRKSSLPACSFVSLSTGMKKGVLFSSQTYFFVHFSQLDIQ